MVVGGAAMDPSEKSGKRWEIFTVAALLCAAAVFIGGFFLVKHLQDASIRYTSGQITEQIISKLNYTDLVKVKNSQISKHFDIPDGVVAECSYYTNKSPEDASELACFILSDRSRYDELKAAVTAHVNAKSTGFKSLNPTQYNALKNYVITQNGKYVLFAVGSNTEAEEKLFGSLFE